MAAMLVQMAISRSREYQADKLGAMICGNPRWLSSALEKIQHGARRIVNEDAEAVPAAAHLFIINPLTGQGMDNLFSTHPNTENRIAELEALEREWAASGISLNRQLGSAGVPAGGLPSGTANPWASAPSAGRSRGPWG